jgi:probable rRNA maturation factor
MNNSENIVTNLTNYQINEKDIINVSNITFKVLDINNPVFNVVLVDEEKIREINRIYRKKDSVTDVISFAFEESDKINIDDIRFLGEIYICVKRAEEQAKEYGHSFKREICYLTVHGLLHLLGYDHIKEEDKVVMRQMEERILEEYDTRRC